VSDAGFAVVLTTRNRPALLADALRSVNEQTWAPLEVVIANDGEQPLELPVSSLGKVPVHVLQVDVRNPGAARNRAVAVTSAPWLAFLDDDDLWRSNHLGGLALALGHPEVEVAYRDCAVIQEEIGADGRRIERARRSITLDWSTPIMRENDFIPPSVTAVRRSAFERLGGFDESFACSEDWDFLLRAAYLAQPMRVPGITVEIRLRPHGNLSAPVGLHRRVSLDRLSERHGLPRLEIKTFWEVAGDLEPLSRAGRP